MSSTVEPEPPAELLERFAELGWSDELVAIALRAAGVDELVATFLPADEAPAGPEVPDASPAAADLPVEHFAVVPVRNGAKASAGRVGYVLRRFEAELAAVGYTIVAVGPPIPQPQEEP